MKSLILTFLYLGISLTYGQEFHTYLTQDQKPYHVIIINSSCIGKGLICGAKGNKIAGFQFAIRTWMFQDSMQTFLDKKNQPLAQIRKENGKLNLYNNNGKLVHTFPAVSPLFALTRSDDIVMIHPKTFEIVDSYSFRVADLLKRTPNPDAFLSISSHIEIVYDAEGNYIQTVSLKSEIPSSYSKSRTDLGELIKSYVASLP